MSVLSVARCSLFSLRPQPLRIKTPILINANSGRPMSVFGMATRVRNHSSRTECARPMPPTNIETDASIAASCKNSKTRASAAIATDALVTAVYDDMIREIERHMETNLEALEELPRLGPMLQELKKAFQKIRNGSEEEYVADLAGKKLGDFYNYTSWTVPEHLKKMDQLCDSLWDSRREQNRIRTQKFAWSGRWCGDENCQESPRNDNVKESHKPESHQKLESQAPEDETEKLKMRSLSLLSQQLRANRVLVQQVRDQKREQGDLKLRLEKMELRVQELEDKALENCDIEGYDGGKEDDALKLPSYQNTPEEDNDEDKTSTTKEDVFDEQERLYDAWNNYDSRIQFVHRGQGKS